MGDKYYESALLRLRRITSYFNILYEDAIKTTNLTPVQFEILLFVDSSAPCSVSDIADFMVVDKSTSSRVLRGIEDRGLIAVEQDKEDRRRRQVSLTDAGEEVVTTLKKSWLSVEKEMCGKYDDAIINLETL